MRSLHVVAPQIDCDNCRTAIERALLAVPGIETVTVEVPSKRIDVTYDPTRISESSILRKLDEEGYPPTEWSG